MSNGTPFPKTDAEKAEDFRARAIATWQPVLDLANEAKSQGFEIIVQNGADDTGLLRVQMVRVTKTY